MEPLLTKKELARMFKVSTRTIDRWRAAGVDLGEVKVAGTTRYQPKKIGAVIARGAPKRPKCIFNG